MKAFTFIRPDGGVSFFPLGRALRDGEILADVFADKEARLRRLMPSPDGTPTKIVPDDWVRGTDIDTDDLPQDRVFRNAWKHDGTRLVEDIDKCKILAHDIRRAARAAEFVPLDIEATIPAKAAEAEIKRQAVRAKYDAVQTTIDAAKTPDEIKAALR